MVLMAIVYLVLVQTVVGEKPSRGDALTETGLMFGLQEWSSCKTLDPDAKPGV
jgi:hypothetical protein